MNVITQGLARVRARAPAGIGERLTLCVPGEQPAGDLVSGGRGRGRGEDSRGCGEGGESSGDWLHIEQCCEDTEYSDW